MKAWEQEANAMKGTQKEVEKSSPDEKKQVEKNEELGDESLLDSAPAANSAWPSPNLASLAASRAKLQGKTWT
jgi:hypothetical protein